MEARKEKFFAEKLADFDYQAETLEALLARLRDSESFYNNLSVEDPRAEMMKKFPSSGNSSYKLLAIQHDITSFKVVQKGRNSDKESSFV